MLFVYGFNYASHDLEPGGGVCLYPSPRGLREQSVPVGSLLLMPLSSAQYLN